MLKDEYVDKDFDECTFKPKMYTQHNSSTINCR